MIRTVSSCAHRERQQFAAKLVEPLASMCAHGENTGIAFPEERIGKKCSYLRANLFETGRADGVGFGDDGQTTTDPEESADREMLFCLWFHAFFGRDDKKYCIDAARARQHIANKETVTGDINETNSPRAIVGPYSIEKSES
jgi:hypothetical protein